MAKARGKEKEDEVIVAVRDGDFTTLKSLLQDLSPLDRRNAVDKKDKNGVPWYVALR